MKEEFSVENRENKSIAYTAMEQLHPTRKSAPRHGYDFEKISSITGRGEEAHSTSGMTQDRPKERAGLGEGRAGTSACLGEFGGSREG